MFTYLFLKVDETIALVDKKELERTTAEVVASEVDLAQFGQFPLEVLSLSRRLAWCVVKEIHVGGGHFQLTFDHVHHSDQLTFLLQYKLLFATQIFRHRPICTTFRHYHTLHVASF